MIRYLWVDDDGLIEGWQDYAQPNLISTSDDTVHTDTHYVVDENIVARPESGILVDKTTTLADGVDEAHITNIPANSVVRVDGSKLDLQGDDFLDISSDEVGSTYVRIEPPFPTKSWEVTITHG